MDNFPVYTPDFSATAHYKLAYLIEIACQSDHVRIHDFDIVF